MATLTDVTPKDIWDALEKAGASSVQAAGIMGNAIAESSLNPEARAIDSNGYYSNGLWQFNEESYPNAGDLVTGHPLADMLAQVNFLMSSGGLQAASGTTVTETAGNFASNFERCQTCQQGGTSFTQRVANAAIVAGWASSGNWPSSAGSASDTATLTAAETTEQNAASAQCAWAIGWGGIPGTSWLNTLFSLGTSRGGNYGSGEVCLLSKSQARALIGVGLLGTGLVITGWGASIVIVVGGIEALSKIGAVQATAGRSAGLVRGLAPAAAAAV